MAAHAMFASREAMEKHERYALQLRAKRESLEADLGIKDDEGL